MLGDPTITGILSLECCSTPPAGTWVQRSNKTGQVKVIGLGLPNENKRYVHEGVTDSVILWNTEHLGYLATGAWTLVIACSMLAGGPFRSWLGWLGVVSALGILAGMLEPAGFALGGTINAFAYILWSLWLIATAIVLLRSPLLSTTE